MTGSTERRRFRPLFLALTMVGALVATLLPMGVASAQTPAPAQARDVELACPPDAEYPDFTDIEGNTFEDLIRCLAAYEITQGGPQGLPANQYGPRLLVRRDQMASFIARMIDAASGSCGEDVGYLPEWDGENEFTDVESNNVHIANINRLADAGIVLGGPGGRPTTIYGPELPVTRDQMASFIARALDFVTDGELPAEADADFFTDDNNNVHEDNINDLAGEGIVQGRGAGIYAPREAVRRDAMSAFIMRAYDLLIEEDFACSLVGDAIRVQLNQTSVAPGGNITGTIFGDVASATVSGPCIGNTSLTTDQDANAEGFQFTLPVSQSAQAGSCTLTFQVTDSAGEVTTVTRNITVTGQQTGAGVTTRPELTSAQILSTITTGQASASQNQGTVVRYTFDEAITAQPAVANLFHVYPSTTNVGQGPGANAGFTGTGICGVGGVVCNLGTAGARGTNQVDVLFGQLSNDPNTPASNPAALVLATVDVGAVTDAQNQNNPEGDAPIGQSGTTTLAAHRTAAPDLLTAGATATAIREPALALGAPAGSRIVDFTFDQAAFVQRTGPGGPGTGNFHLIGTNGQRVDCTASTSTAAASGQNTPGGSGTTTISVLCGPIPGTGAALAQPATAETIARGIVDAGAVASAATAAPCPGAGPTAGATAGTTVACNPQQATETPDQNTTTPDLTTVTLRPAANATSADEVVYTFDEPILATNPATGTAPAGAGFYVYQTGGNQVLGSVQGTAPQVSGNQVVVFYPNGTLSTVTGGGIFENAVTGSNTNLQNRQDEEGVSNPNTFTQTPGRTAGPDLTQVNLVQGLTGFSTTFTAIYTFDAQIAAGGGLASNNPTGPAGAGSLTTAQSNRFKLYLSDGSQLICQQAVTTNFATASALSGSQVACQNYAFGAGQAGTNAGAATAAQIGSATLGTVDDGAVFNATSATAGGTVQTNPEGAEPTQGGTGTPQS